MSDNLIERLRSPATVFYEYDADEGALLRDVADAIERLTRERDEARKELDDLIGATAGMDARAEAAEAERDALIRSTADHVTRNSDLAAQVEALRRLIRDMLDNDPADMAADGVTVLDVWRRDAIAALTKETDQP